MELSQMKDHQLKSVFIHYVTNSVIAMAALSFNVFTDTFFIANGIGSQALAALNVALPMFSILNGIALMCAMGCATRYTLLKAGNHHQEANEVFTHGIIGTTIQSLVFFLLGLFFVEDVALLLGADASLLKDVMEYLTPLLLLGMLFQFNQLFICQVRNDNASRLAMIAMVCGNLMNIVLDYIFIYQFHWGLFGASLASCFSPLTSILILSIHRFQRKNQFHLIKIKFNFKLMIEIYRLGIPFFVNELSSGVVILAFNYMFLIYGGNTAIAAYGIVANLALIIQSIFSGVGQGIQPIVSHLYGSGKFSQTWKVSHYAIVLTVVLGIFFVSVGMMFPDSLIAIFNSDGNQQLAMIAHNGILLYFPAFLFSGFSIALASFFSSIHASDESTLISMGRGIVFVLIFLFTLPFILGENGVWLSVPAAEILTAILTLYFYLKIYNRQKKLILNENEKKI